MALSNIFSEMINQFYNQVDDRVNNVYVILLDPHLYDGNIAYHNSLHILYTVLKNLYFINGLNQSTRGTYLIPRRPTKVEQYSIRGIESPSD